MLHSLMTLLTAVVAADGSGRSKRRRFHRPRPAQEELGKWIWIGAQDGAPARNSYVYFRKLVNLSSKPGSAIIKAAADSKYKLYVNGRYVGKGPARPSAGTAYYDTHDISHILAKGDNVIAFVVHHFGEPRYAGPAGRPGLNCRAEIELDNGRVVVASDETWKTHRATDWTDQGDRLNKSLGFQEVYDAGARIENWNQVRFSERDWQSAVVVNLPDRLVPRRIPLLRQESILPAAVVGTFNSPPRSKETAPGAVPRAMSSATLSPLKAGSVKGVNTLLSEDGAAHVGTPRGDEGVGIMLDFGREVFGNVEIGIAGSGGGLIDIGYGEMLQDGRVKPDRGGMSYTDRILLAKGRLEWQSFEPRAFRYMQIEFRWASRPVSIDYIRVNQTTYPASHTGGFECSDSLLNQIWKTAAHTTELCMEDSFISSPWRDRALNWADVSVAARAAYYAFDDTALLAQALREVADSQTKDGALPGVCAPGQGEPPVDLMLLWVLSVLEYYAFSDDAELVRELYPSARRLMQWISGYAGEDSLVGGIPGGPFIDDADLDRRGDVTALNCLYYQALRVAGALAGVLGYQVDAEHYAETANRLKLAVNKYLYSPSRGLYAECRVEGKLVERYSRQTNIFAALFDIADQYRRSTIFRQTANGSLPELGTPYFASYLLEALYAGELYDEALDYIRRKWGSMANGGATAFWERFNGEGAHCRGWSACPARDLIAEYVGIKPALGARRFSVAPHTGGLAWARGAINTDGGPLTVEWRSARNQLTIRVEVPAGVKVDVYPPGAATSKISLDGRSQPSRFITLGSGAHAIKVTAAPPSKLPRADKALEPEPVAHVEILDDVFPRGLRRLRVGVGRERGERRRAPRGRRDREERPAAPKAEEPAAARPPESVAEPAARAEAGKPAREARRRRRSTRKRPEAKPAEARAPEPAPAPEPEPGKEQPGKASRRGGRRRRPSRKPAPETSHDKAGEQPAPPPAPKPEQASEPAKPAQPRSRRRPRHKRPDHGERAV